MRLTKGPGYEANQHLNKFGKFVAIYIFIESFCVLFPSHVTN